MKAFILLLVVFVIFQDCDAYASVKRSDIEQPKCSNTDYGCCNDGQTEKKGPNNQGCGYVDMIDETPVSCKMKKDKGELECLGLHGDQCCHTCDLCKSPDPSDKCKGEPNCCWDGTLATSEGCPDCQRMEWIFKDPCRRFKDIYGGCDSGSFKIRNFMQKHCPMTCKNLKC